MQKNTLTLNDAIRATGPLSFNLMAKPVGSLCNLGCKYCYYLDKSRIYGGYEPKMSDEHLRLYVKSFIEGCETPRVTFTWHGGEPLLAGLDFFRAAMKYQKLYANGKKIVNTIQTNGTLVSSEWAEFFRDEEFLVGVSIDGPQDIHDKMRLDKGGQPTFDKVVKGIEKMYAAGVQYNLMTAVNHCSEGHALEIYQFLKTLGTSFIQFLPVAEMIDTGICGGKVISSPAIAPPDSSTSIMAPWGVSAEGWGDFLCEIFDWWSGHDAGRIFVNVFEDTLAGWCGVRPGSCVFDSVCGGNAVMEHNGDIYPCDHFVYPGMRAGNIFCDNLKDLMGGKSQTEFGARKRIMLTDRCLKCRYLAICNGECPKHRFVSLPGEGFKHNVLCDGYLKFFRHSENVMLRMKEMIMNANQ